ncbi:MAG: carboxylating nicotinate-nucleotide diphosphorylase [Spirochaetia bacterium]|nr:carboxylating nicotinate-nucleotide diphosphorylase [Spirochaetia bacterium]
MKSEQNDRAYIQAVKTIDKKNYQNLIELAIEEDDIKRDISTNSIFPESKKTNAILISKDKGILCGSQVFSDVLRTVDQLVQIKFRYSEGDDLNFGDSVAEISGNIQSILRSERIALNFLSFMSGIASHVRQALEILRPWGILPLDTRKTLPGYRILSKYAVNIGGGMNHRINLSEMGLIKDNHIAAAGGVKKALQMFRSRYPDKKCEVEVENMPQLQDALSEKPDMILLDNMSPVQVKICAGAIKNFNNTNHTAIICEASGGYSLENIHLLADTGVDYVSMGSLTNHIRPFDFSLEIEGY